MPRLPFYYGWVMLGCASLAAISRAGPAVATLSIFLEPMTREFGWSRSAMAGAVSLGGVLAAVVSPMLGSLLDRIGPRLILCGAVLTTGVTLLALSRIESLLAFYLLFCVARLNFAGPFDLGINGVVSNWFVRQRATAASVAQVTQMAGLFSFPLIAHFAMQNGGWRSGWLAIGTVVLVVGFLPSWVLMVRRPEDIGLLPDGGPGAAAHGAGGRSNGGVPAPEPAFTRAEALRTRAFWMLALFTAMAYPVQAGVSLHQAAHMIERGVSAGTAVAAVSTFSVMSAISGLLFGALARRSGVRLALLLSALLLIVAALFMSQLSGPVQGFVSGVLFGSGIGGLQTILPVAWADYFGRRNYGAIRGVALTIQVTAQASGPIISGVLRDLTGDYTASLICFACFATLAAVAALLIRAPQPPPAAAATS